MHAPLIRAALLLLLILGSDAASAAPVSTPVMSAIAGGTASFAVPPQAGATYQWKKDGRPLISVGRLWGATTPTLTVSRVGKGDIGTYACDVTKAGVTITRGATFLRFMRKPQVTAPPPDPASVSHDFEWQITADEAVSTYSVTGLPPGLACDAKTGLITGKPNVGGTKAIKVTARNAAGAGTARSYSLSVESFPAVSVGRFYSTVGRSPSNADLGGVVNVTITATGAVTGRLDWGTGSHPFAGRADYVAGQNPRLAITIPTSSDTAVTLTGEIEISPQANDQGVLKGDVEGAAFYAAKIDRSIDREYALTFMGIVAYQGMDYYPDYVPDDPGLPGGRGWQRTAISTSGAVTISGRLGDGASFALSAPMASGGVGFRQLLYGSHGSMIGWSTFTYQNPYGESIVGTNIWGSIDWAKNGPASATDRTYAAGFQALLEVRGGFLYPGNFGYNWLYGADEPDNAYISFYGPDIASADNDPSQVFHLTFANNAYFSSDPSVNPCGVRMKVDPATGNYTGSCTLKTGGVSRALTFRGHAMGGGSYSIAQDPGDPHSPIVTGVVDVSRRN